MFGNLMFGNLMLRNLMYRNFMYRNFWAAHLGFACLLVAAPALAGVAQSPSGPMAVPSQSQAQTLPSPPAAGSAARLPLKDALTLYRNGDFSAAIAQFQQALRDDPKSPDAYAGMTRAYLRQKNMEQAWVTVRQGLAAVDSPTIRAALGEVYFRQGKIHEAEREWVQIINSGDPEPRAFLGLCRVRNALALYKSGKAMIDKAHALSPQDPEITREWIATLRRPDRIRYLEDYLAGPNNDDSHERESTRTYIDYLRAREQEPAKKCHLLGKMRATETDLVRLLMDPQHLRGYGLAVSVNGRKANLMLDTGASGILLERGIAEKAGIAKTLETRIGGIGDQGSKSGFLGIAGSIKIGDLEIQDCPVEVLEKRSVVGEQGLIGADVFAQFLVELDFPHEKLRLSESPRRPDDPAGPPGLRTDEGNSGLSDSDETDSGGKTAAAPAPDKAREPVSLPFRDAYLAPEMKSFTRVLRFGHMILVPTAVGKVQGKLFLMNTGALDNHITPTAAREVTKFRGDPETTVTGLSGSVKNVYSADKAVLQFGRLRQENQDMLTFNLDALSGDAGTEISGTLGFVLLHFLDVKIDYRDNLVDFAYRDPSEPASRKK
jgi:tetratricopeptide (TPR) repeat protein